MASLAALSVLVVDANSGLREAIARFLEDRGCIVTTAANGVQGLELIRRQQFDVVISDVQMPERGGLWLYEQAVTLQPTLRGRFVFITSEPRAELEGMGVFYLPSEYFLLKPVSLQTLWRQIGDIVQRDGRGGDGPRDPASTEEARVEEKPSRF